jgi:NADH dehydrogenase/NADH:ubiquinone oxidoreductase subunit G
MVKIVINGKEVNVPKNTTVLEAARMKDISIPTLCYHPKLTPFGGCRLCIVEIKGIPSPIASCTTIATDGMEISTSTPYLEELRKTVLELILSDHPNDCMVCEQTGNCTLQNLAYAYGIRESEFSGERRVYARRDGNPFIERDLEKCILCGRCVKVCDEIQGVEAIDFGYRGFNSKICTYYEEDLNCEFCGQCVAVCPTGALTGKLWERKGRPHEVKETETVCPYCGTGCNITVQVKENEIVRIESRPDTWNEGWLCVKGRFGFRFANSPDRLSRPLIKMKGKFVEVSWEEALDYVATKLKTIRKKYSADTIAGLSSARCTNEENYLFQKFMRAALGTNNVDHCARL